MRCFARFGSICTIFGIKSNTPPWALFTFFRLYKWYQIAQRTTYFANNINNFKLHLRLRVSPQEGNHFDQRSQTESRNMSFIKYERLKKYLKPAKIKVLS